MLEITFAICIELLRGGGFSSKTKYVNLSEERCRVGLDRSLNFRVACLDVMRKHWAGGVNLGKNPVPPKELGMLRAQGFV